MELGDYELVFGSKEERPILTPSDATIESLLYLIEGNDEYLDIVATMVKEKIIYNKEFYKKIENIVVKQFNYESKHIPRIKNRATELSDKIEKAIKKVDKVTKKLQTKKEQNIEDVELQLIKNELTIAKLKLDKLIMEKEYLESQLALLEPDRRRNKINNNVISKIVKMYK